MCNVSTYTRRRKIRVKHTNTRALKDQRRTESSSTNNDLLSRLVDLGLVLTWSKRFGRNNLNTNSSATFHDDFLNLGVADQVQVRVMSTSTVDICMSRV